MSTQAWVPPSGPPGPIPGLRYDVMANVRARDPAFIQMPAAFAAKPQGEWPKIFQGHHKLPEDVRRAFAAQPGKEFNGEFTDPAILHERLRDMALNCLDGGCAMALESFAADKNLRKAWSHIGAAPLRGEKGNGRATQHDAGNLCYSLTVEVLRHMAKVDGSHLTLQCSNLELVADHVEAVLGVAMAEGKGRYEQQYPWRVERWVLDRFQWNQRLGAMLMKLIAAVTDMCTVFPFDMPKHSRSSRAFAAAAAKWCASVLEARPQTGTPTLQDFMHKRRGTAGDSKKRYSAERLVRSRMRAKKRCRGQTSCTCYHSCMCGH